VSDSTPPPGDAQHPCRCPNIAALRHEGECFGALENPKLRPKARRCTRRANTLWHNISTRGSDDQVLPYEIVTVPAQATFTCVQFLLAKCLPSSLREMTSYKEGLQTLWTNKDLVMQGRRKVFLQSLDERRHEDRCRGIYLQ
jgi:hypothetical protein